jgi:hypothetical protein
MRVVLVALEAYAQSGNTPATQPVPAPAAPPVEPPEMTPEHQRRAEAVLRRAGVLP